MITKFHKYNESLRDMMTPVSDEQIGSYINSIINWHHNMTIADNIYDAFYKNDYETGYDDHLFDFIPEFDKDYIINKIPELFKNKSSLSSTDEWKEKLSSNLIDKLLNNKTYFFGDEFLYYKNEYGIGYDYHDFIKDLINGYDNEKFKEISKDLIEYEMTKDKY